jgi:hypothetical protein
MVGDVIADGVKRAYEVIDSYVNEGRRAAEKLIASANSTSGRSPTGNLESTLEKMVRRQTDLLPLWLELFGALTIMERPQGLPASSIGTTLNGNNSLAIDISSLRPVQIHVNLTKQISADALEVLDANPVGGGAPPISGTVLISKSGVDVLRIKVPDDQPPGIYIAVIAERGVGNPCGSVTIKVR